jgi:hypothetical protein
LSGATVPSEENRKFIKLKLKARKLNGLFYAALQEGAKMWSFQKNEICRRSAGEDSGSVYALRLST